MPDVACMDSQAMGVEIGHDQLFHYFPQFQKSLFFSPGKIGRQEENRTYLIIRVFTALDPRKQP